MHRLLTYSLWYNITIADNIMAPIASRAIQLLPNTTWGVWRRGRWYGPTQDRPPPDSKRARRDLNGTEDRDLTAANE